MSFSFSPEELKKLAAPALTAFALLVFGIALVWTTGDSLRMARQQLAAAQAERMQNGERLARIAEEEREVKEKIAVYQQLKQLNIVGEERRLEWADAMTRIRAQRELLDMRYRVERVALLGGEEQAPELLREADFAERQSQQKQQGQSALHRFAARSSTVMRSMSHSARSRGTRPLPVAAEPVRDSAHFFTA